MGEHLEDDGRGHGFARLAVVAVEHHATRPPAKQRTQVAVNLREHLIANVARDKAGGTAGEFAVGEIGRVNAQRADKGAVGGVACIGVEGYAELKRYMKTRVAGHIGRAFGEIVLHERARIDVFGIVVCGALASVYFIRSTGPLYSVASGFEETGQAADCQGVATSYVAHSTPEAHGICGDNTAVVALVGERYAIVLTVASVEEEGAKINPCAAAHLLVDAETGALTSMAHGVKGIADAGGHSRIGHVNGIVAIFGDSRNPNDAARLRATSLRSRHTCSTIEEWIVAIDIYLFRQGEAHAGIIPAVLPVDLEVKACFVRAVVIDDDFMLLPIAFAWRIDYSACILKHGHEIRHDKGLRQQVFGGTEEARTLPLPFVIFQRIELAMARPQTDMMPVETVFDIVLTVNRLHPRIAAVTHVFPSALQIACSTRHQFIDEVVVDVNI